MEAISYTRLRANLADVMQQVVEDHDPVIITRKSQPGVVMLSLEDFEAMQETAYLMKSPVNAKRLVESIEQLAENSGQRKGDSDLEILANDD